MYMYSTGEDNLNCQIWPGGQELLEGASELALRNMIRSPQSQSTLARLQLSPSLSQGVSDRYQCFHCNTADVAMCSTMLMKSPSNLDRNPSLRGHSNLVTYMPSFLWGSGLIFFGTKYLIERTRQRSMEICFHIPPLTRCSTALATMAAASACVKWFEPRMRIMASSDAFCSYPIPVRCLRASAKMLSPSVTLGFSSCSLNGSYVPTKNLREMIVKLFFDS